MSKRKRLPGVRAWAWECDFGLCAWADPDKASLMHYDKPSPEAKPVLVRLVRERELRRLAKAAEAAKGAK